MIGKEVYIASIEATYYTYSDSDRVIMAGEAAYNMNFASKRKREEVEPDTKKIKNFINEKERPEFSSSNEWPVYNHPDGGIVKITPWGSVRQYMDASGNTVTKFEDMNFQDISFANSHQTANVYEMPSTPVSMNQNSNNYSSPSMYDVDGIKLSPSDEAENYVINGYGRLQGNGAQQQQFQQEHENYFGMEDHDLEYDEMVKI